MEEQSAPLDPQIDLAPTSWPKVVGIISIAWACLGLSCLACGVTMQLAIGPSMLEPQVRDNPPPSMRFGLLQVIQTAISLVTSLLLLGAGIQTLRRSMVGRTLHLVWAGISVLALIYGAYVGWLQQQEMQVWARNNPGSRMAEQTLKGGTGLGLAIMGIFIALFSIWPVFCLIWFGLVKRTKESFGAPPNADFI